MIITKANTRKKLSDSLNSLSLGHRPPSVRQICNKEKKISVRVTSAFLKELYLMMHIFRRCLGSLIKFVTLRDGAGMKYR